MTVSVEGNLRASERTLVCRKQKLQPYWVSTQQYGKYERGENRLTASRDEMLERYFGDKAAGLAEPVQARYQAPISKSSLQKSLDQIRAAVELLQRHLDRL